MNPSRCYVKADQGAVLVECRFTDTDLPPASVDRTQTDYIYAIHSHSNWPDGRRVACDAVRPGTVAVAVVPTRSLSSSSRLSVSAAPRPIVLPSRGRRGRVRKTVSEPGPIRAEIPSGTILWVRAARRPRSVTDCRLPPATRDADRTTASRVRRHRLRVPRSKASPGDPRPRPERRSLTAALLRRVRDSAADYSPVIPLYYPDFIC